jgi:hypothetical protein
MLPVDDIRIEPSQLGEEAGVLGAIALAAQKLGTVTDFSSESVPSDGPCLDDTTASAARSTQPRGREIGNCP